MLWLNPDEVTLGGASLANVSSVMLSRRAEALVVEHDASGPHAVFADAPRRRVEVVVRRTLTADEPAPAGPGDEVPLELTAAPAAGGPPRRRVSMTVVVAAVEHALSRGRGFEQTIRAVAVSPSGSQDPVVETPLEG